MQCLPLGPGELISRNGVYDLTMAQYHGQPADAPSISNSGLKDLWRSPAHFWGKSRINPANWVCEDVDGVLTRKFLRESDRPHFSLGRAAHHLIFLGRKGFDREFVVRPEKWKDYRTDAAKDWRKLMIKAGLTIITVEELEQITGMAKSLAAHPLVKAGILDGAVERSLIFKSPETGLWLKSRPDNITLSDGDFSDLKTCVDVGADALQKTINSFGYHMQGGLVGMAAEVVLDVEMKSFTNVFVEKTHPFCVEAVTIEPEDIFRGRLQVEAMMRRFSTCLTNDNWPGPGGDQSDARMIGLRKYDRDRIDAQLELLKQTEPFRHHEAA